MSVFQESFHYLHDAREAWREEEPSACVICNMLCACYGFIQMHEEGYDEYRVCGPCLVSGRLAEKNLHVNDGDIETLHQQLHERFREMPEEERNALATKRTSEIELRTPRPSVLNLFIWPAHCGDYCVYFRRVNAEDMNRLAPDGDGRSFLASHLPLDYEDVDEDLLQNVWEEKLQGFLRFYLWQCTHCSQYLLTCDSD